MLFGKKKQQTAPKQTEPKEYPEKTYTFKQTKNYRGFKRIKLTSYGYQPALDGIHALANADLTDADISITVVDKPDSPFATVKVGDHLAGTIFKQSFDQFDALRSGDVSAVRLEIRDGESFLFYKV